ncbi:MAG: hypothetical protein ABI868_16890 [Acidobacteriota bacterium]
MSSPDRPNLPNPGIGGWLIVLCGLLFLVQPISTGLVAARMLVLLPIRGVPAALVVILRLATTGLGVAAGLALIGLRPGAVALTRFAVAASAATDLIIYLSPYFPNHRAPGETPVYVLVSLAYHLGWLAYLFRSKRVAAIDGGA